MQRGYRALVALIVLSMMMASAQGARAGGNGNASATTSSTLGNFEVDGNLVDDATVAGLDWDTLNPSSRFEFTDGTGSGDTSFQSSKELTPDGWQLVSGSVPQKDDILKAGVGLAEVSANHWLYLYFTRLGNNGDAFLNFEFNRSGLTYLNSVGSRVPIRTAGDLLVTLTVTNGGQKTDIQLLTWQGTKESGKWVAPSIQPTPVRGTDWQATTNADSQGRFTLGEAALRLEAFKQGPHCPGFGKAWVKSTSSQSYDVAAMKDRTERQDLNLSTCGTITLNKIDDLTSKPLNGATFDLWKDDGDGKFDASKDTLIDQCLTGENNDGQCTFVDVEPAGYFVRESAAPDGYAKDPTISGPIAVAIKQNVTISRTFVDHKLLPKFTVSKTASPMDPKVGDTVTYQVTVTNTGDGPGSASVSDDYDENHVSITDNGGGTDENGKLTWTTPVLDPAGGSVTYTYKGTIKGPFTGTPSDAVCKNGTFPVSNEVTVTGGASSKVTVCVTAAPAFTVDKTALNPSAVVGDVVTYTVKVTNIGDGPGIATATDDYDEAHLTITSVGGGSNQDGKLTWTTARLDPSESVTYTYSGKIKGPFNGAPGGDVCSTTTFPVINTVTVTGGARDASTVCVSAEPAFDVTKTASTASAKVGDSVTYTVTVKNVGDGSGSTAVHDDYDQDHLTITDNGGGTDENGVLSWTTDRLDPTKSVTYTYTGTIKGPFNGEPGGTDCTGGTFPVTNIVSVDGDSARATVCVTALPVYTIEKTADPTSANIGDTVTYTVKVSNVGDGPGSTTVTDDYDESHVTITNTGGGSDANGVLTWTTQQLDPSGTETFTYTGTVKGPYTGEDAQEGCGTNQFPVNNAATAGTATSSARVCVTALPQSSLNKQVSNVSTGTGPATTMAAGPTDTLEYTLTYKNIGQADATDVTVTDALPAHSIYGSCAPVAICSLQNGIITWNIGTVPAGGIVPVTFRVNMANDFADGWTLIPNTGSATTHQETAATPSNRVTVSVTILRGLACPTQTVPGGSVSYTIPYGVYGGTVTGATIVDHLPSGFRYASASPTPKSAPAPGQSGDVVFDLGTLHDGDHGTVQINGTISPSASEGYVTNTIESYADGIPSKSTSYDIEITVKSALESSRAYGISLTLNGKEVVVPTPDTIVANPANVVHFSDPVTGTLAQIDALDVASNGWKNTLGSHADAVATTGDVKLLNQGGTWLITATALRGLSSSDAALDWAGSSAAGSVLSNVRVNGVELGTIAAPKTIQLHDPILGTTTTVKLLEKIPAGAGEGIEQPDGDSYWSALEVNAIHVSVIDSAGKVVTDLIVGHAYSVAAFPSGLGCGEVDPHVSASGYALRVPVDESIVDPSNSLGLGEIARVVIPRDGGSDSASVAHVGPVAGPDGLTLVESNTAFSDAVGAVDRAANSAWADDESQTEKLRLLEQNTAGVKSYLVSADLVRATSHSQATDDHTASSEGSTTIANLQIAGRDVCAVLGLADPCAPQPNTVLPPSGPALIVLNEQIPGSPANGASSLTVNAIHVYILGLENPFGLPAGAEIIVSNAHSGAAAAGASAVNVSPIELLPSPAPAPAPVPVPTTTTGLVSIPPSLLPVRISFL